MVCTTVIIIIIIQISDHFTFCATKISVRWEIPATLRASAKSLSSSSSISKIRHFKQRNKEDTLIYTRTRGIEIVECACSGARKL